MLFRSVFYRNRVVKHPDEVTVKGEDLEINKSYLLGGITSFMTYGLLAAGIGAMNIVMDIVEDKEGIIYGLAGLVPLVIAIWLIAKYSKWMFKYIVWVLRRKGLLQVVDDKDSK